MDAQVVIEWERPSTDGLPTNNYLASLVETYISGRFVSVLDQGEKWAVIWYPNISFNQGCTFDCGFLKAARSGVELWAAHRGKGLLPYDDLDRCCSSSCEQHPL